DEWHLPRLFFLAGVMGGFLTTSTLVLYLIKYSTDWFEDWFGLPDLSNPEIRGLLYLVVSVTSQGTVFLTRTRRWFFFPHKRPTLWLILAFIVAQVVATLIG